MKESKIPVDKVIEVIGEVISDSEPKTRVGRWLRWLKKAIQIKSSLGINIQKNPPL
jgi:hypothetical protein